MCNTLGAQQDVWGIDFMNTFIVLRKIKYTNVAILIASMMEIFQLWEYRSLKKLMYLREGDVIRLLCKREALWIFQFRTRMPHGLNFEWNIIHFYY